MAFSYRLDIESAGIASHFAAEAGRDAWSGGPLAPGKFAPVIARAGREAKRLIRPMHWGFPAPGQSTEFLGSEPPRWVPTVRNLESPFWIGNLRHRELRCLIPATSFAVGTGKTRRWFRVNDESVLALAGTWRDLTDMPVFAVICCEPPPGLPVTSMPLILSVTDQEQWLTTDWKEAKALVRPFPPAQLESIDTLRG